MNEKPPGKIVETIETLRVELDSQNLGDLKDEIQKIIDKGIPDNVKAPGENTKVIMRVFTKRC